MEKKGTKINTRVLDEAVDINPETFRKLQDSVMPLNYFKMACMIIPDLSKTGANPFDNERNYVFTQDRVVKGVGKFIGKHRVDGSFMFMFDHHLPDGNYMIILSGTEQYEATKSNQEYYYLWNGGYVGNAMLWWRKGGAGYTTNLDEAHKFTKEEAMNYQKARNSDIPYLCAHVDDKSIRIADSQHIDYKFSIRSSD